MTDYVTAATAVQREARARQPALIIRSTFFTEARYITYLCRDYTDVRLPSRTTLRRICENCALTTRRALMIQPAEQSAALEFRSSRGGDEDNGRRRRREGEPRGVERKGTEISSKPFPSPRSRYNAKYSETANVERGKVTAAVIEICN